MITNKIYIEEILVVIQYIANYKYYKKSKLLKKNELV